METKKSPAETVRRSRSITHELGELLANTPYTKYAKFALEMDLRGEDEIDFDRASAVSGVLHEMVALIIRHAHHNELCITARHEGTEIVVEFSADGHLQMAADGHVPRELDRIQQIGHAGGCRVLLRSDGETGTRAFVAIPKAATQCKHLIK